MDNLFHGFAATVRKFAAKSALRFEGRAIAFADVYSSALGVARRLGDRRGRHVGLLAGNTPAFVAGYFGILGAGATAVPFNAMLTDKELVPLARHADLAALLVSRALTPLIAPLQAGLPDTPILVIEDIAPAGGIDDDAPYASSLGLEDLAMLLYTSGTTGDPKGVMLTHKNFIANFNSFSQVFNFNEHDTFIDVLPLFHSFAFTGELLSCALLGVELILCPAFKPKEVLELMATERNVVLLAVPPMYAVLTAFAPAGYDARDNVRYLVSGGGPMPAEVQARFEERFGIEIYEGYGLTEAAPVVSSNSKLHDNRRGTIGRALPGVRVEIWDEAGTPLPAGVEGELMVKGDNVMRGYYKNPAATAEALTADGWLRTGDMAVIDNDGFLRIVGRKKELIVSAGENIHPREVEETLVRHPAVFEAAVIGVPDKLKTEVPKAFLAPHPGQPLDSIDIKEVRDFLRDRLAAHKIPALWAVLEQLPKLPTGKINKKILPRE